MREEIERCFQRLENLSIRELAHSAETVASREKRNVAVLIAHLAEISKRRVHLRLGYKSLFDYCVKHLRLSEGSAWSRIQVANVARRFPQALVHLAEGKVSLSVLGLLSPKLERANVERLLSDAEGKTKREVQEYLAGLEPKDVKEGRRRRHRARDLVRTR